MTPIGFKVVDAYALEVQEIFLDLHNDYEFLGWSIELKQQVLQLSWQRLTEEHVSPKLPRSLRLVVKGAERVVSLPQKDSWKSGGGQTTSFIGFLNVDQEQVMNGCLDYIEAGEAPDFIVGFEDESALKIFGRDGTLEAELDQGSAAGMAPRE